ncbi:DUF4249 domain-containing protein [Hymenobacter sp. HSC-4F20]|uniref:DUF4249 domain-containing protein n=1 Tax=Hymenobacter sp. HSC-4F20 TaxID=2864135 RepID=UPI001C72E3F5|nr:DUF4249 domain-containing protein [Hymenobacter sp. HSC-4F20]MBX0292675.1 DUF4249 domain-containing protein [Hymenobacter sp. HSC-4F20]
MRRLLFPLSGYLVLLLAVGSCVQEYLPEVINSTESYLVVDGFINGQGVSTIRLSKTVHLTTQNGFPSETKATVAIQSQSGQRYPLTENEPGVYVTASQQLPANEQYRLHIRTAGGREYASDYTLLKHTPALDRFEGQIQANGLQIYVSAHDEQAQTRYYRWEYEETWAFTSAFRSTLTFDGQRVVPRTENIYNCWRTQNSMAINTFSTVRLSQDAVRDYRLLFIPASSGRLQSLYSLRVRQYALSAEEFDYWEAVKKNTENIGTLFDPLPSQVQGNVHSLTDPDEPVLGFVGATTEVSQRLFINRHSLPPDWHSRNEGYESCTELDTFPSQTWRGWTLQEYFADPQQRIPVGRVGPRYTAQSPQCVDCRVLGTNVKPSFWP